jgi:hypothetical protein
MLLQEIDSMSADVYVLQEVLVSQWLSVCVYVCVCVYVFFFCGALLVLTAT